MVIANKMNYSYFETVVFGIIFLVSYVVSSTLPSATTEQTSSTTSQFYSCLQNCANCVQFWEYGLYNGRRCAKRCLHQQGREIVDPDCNNPKMFNYSPRIIDLLLETQRTQQQQQPASAEDEEMLGDQPASVRETLNPKTQPKNHGLMKRKDSSEEVTERFEVEVKAQHVHQGKFNSSKRARHHQHRHKGNRGVDGLQFERRRASPSHVARRLQDGARWNRSQDRNISP